MMTRVRPVLTAVVAFTVGACGATQPGSDADDPQVEAGRSIYARYCALCHGERGEGYAADDATALANQQMLATATDRHLRAAIVRGRPGTPMSAWGQEHGGPLDQHDVDALLRLLRSWQTVPSVDVHRLEVSGDAERGAALYARSCAGCHGADGEGGGGTTLDNPVFHDTASDGFIRHAIVHGRSGTPMPAFGERLEDGAIDDLVAHIRSLRRPGSRGAAALEGPEAVIIHPDGPHPDLALRDETYVPVDEVKRALDDGARLVLVDARAASDYRESHIPGAISIPFYGVDDAVERLPRDGTWIVAYCGCPHAASGRVVRELREHGFSRTAVLDEGLNVWVERGYPIARSTEAGP